MRNLRAFILIDLAVLGVVGAAVSWVHARHTVLVGPVTDGQPVTTSTAYDPLLLLLTLLLATVAGVLAVLGAARLRKPKWRSGSPTPSF